MKKYTNEKGIAMFVVLATMAVVITVATVVIYIAKSETRLTNSYTNREMANNYANNYAEIIGQEWENWSTPINFESFKTSLPTSLSLYDISLSYKLTGPSASWGATTDGEKPIVYEIGITSNYKDEEGYQKIKLWYVDGVYNGYYIGEMGNLVVKTGSLLYIDDFTDKIISFTKGEGNPPYIAYLDDLVIDAWYYHHQRNSDEAWILLKNWSQEYETGSKYKITLLFNYLGYYNDRSGYGYHYNYIDNDYFSLFFLMDSYEDISRPYIRPEDLSGYALVLNPKYRYSGLYYVKYGNYELLNPSYYSYTVNPSLHALNEFEKGTMLPEDRVGDSSLPNKLEVFFEKSTDEVEISYKINDSDLVGPNAYDINWWYDTGPYIGLNVCSSRVAIKSIMLEKID